MCTITYVSDNLKACLGGEKETSECMCTFNLLDSAILLFLILWAHCFHFMSLLQHLIHKRLEVPHGCSSVKVIRQSLFLLYHASIFFSYRFQALSRIWARFYSPPLKCSALGSSNLMSFVAALLSFERILEESCYWFGFEVSFTFERIKVFMGKMPCFIRLWTYFSLFRSNAGSLSWHPTLYALSRITVLLSAILSASAYSAIPLFRIPLFRYSVFPDLKTPCTSICVYLNLPWIPLALSFGKRSSWCVSTTSSISHCRVNNTATVTQIHRLEYTPSLASSYQIASQTVIVTKFSIKLSVTHYIKTYSQCTYIDIQHCACPFTVNVTPVTQSICY